MSDVAGGDPWTALRALTPARLALGHTGVSLPTAAELDFRMAHARARDAVHHPLDAAALAAALESVAALVLRVHSAAADRAEYLRRPDLGRVLDARSTATLDGAADGEVDVVFVVADGLSAQAAERHAAPLLARVVPALRSAGWTLGPTVVAEQARVAMGDAVGAALRARLVAVLIGERPGLTSPDSLGVYLTWDPRPGRTDAERNCISNVRPQGLAYDEAAHRLAWLMAEARRRGVTGIALRDEAPPLTVRPTQIQSASGEAQTRVSG
jgi:ethanolamine ammonia-lyase small subunit